MLIVAAGVAMLSAIAWAVWPRPATRPAVAPVTVDALDALAPRVAYDSALVLATAGRTLESLPFYRRALRGVQDDFWQLHADYGSALYNLTLEITERRGVVTGRTRSTWERAALIRESIEESARARDLAESPRDRAHSFLLGSRITLLYGFPWETFVAYRQAQFADASDPALRLRADRFQATLEHPTAVNPIRTGAATDDEP